MRHQPHTRAPAYLPSFVWTAVVICSLMLHHIQCNRHAGAEAAGRDATLADIQLNPNPYSWSKTAHVVYIDSPAGTGFSYTPGEETYYTSDDKTIDDLVVFVAGFFDEHPWLARQPLYVAGKSLCLLQLFSMLLVT